jgi:hypothetical protein
MTTRINPLAKQQKQPVNYNDYENNKKSYQLDNIRNNDVEENRSSTPNGVCSFFFFFYTRLS